MQVTVVVKESNFLVETNNQFKDFDISVQAMSSFSSSSGNGCRQLKQGISIGILQIAVQKCDSDAG